MGFIAALLSKKGTDVSTLISRMLRSASPNRADGYGVADCERVAHSTRPMDPPDFRSAAMIGYKFVKVMPLDPPQPVSQHGYAMVFDGRLWSKTGHSDLQAAADAMGRDPVEGLGWLIENGDGSYAAAAAERDRIVLGRDHVGVVPLYIGENEALVGASSNVKALRSAGIGAESFPPGHVAELTKDGIKIRGVRTIRRMRTRRMSIEDAVTELDGVLLSSVESRSRGLFSAPLGFSGGIDSALVAHYLKRSGVRVGLVCVGVEGSSDLKTAETAAESLDLPIVMRAFRAPEIEEELDAALASVEEDDPMKVSVALPLRLAVMSRPMHGDRVFFSGNGSDELFGGYRKYVRLCAASREEASRAMLNDVSKSHLINYERDYKVCADLGVELRLPFADPRIVDFGLAMPLEMRVSADESSPRKPLLRALAKRIGLPDEIVMAQKRAIQYSTGVSKALNALAKEQGVSLHGYLHDRFEKLKGHLSAKA
jgi:asparagine synthase (glutamine-hydrolysing)